MLFRALRALLPVFALSEVWLDVSGHCTLFLLVIPFPNLIAITCNHIARSSSDFHSHVNPHGSLACSSVILTPIT